MIADRQVDLQTVDRFAESLRSRGKQPATVESYCRDAQRFLDYLGRYKVEPSQVEPETLLAFQEFLRSDCEERDNSVRRTVIGVRQFYRFLSDSQAIRATPFDMVPIPVRDDRLPKGLSPDDVESLLRSALSGRPEIKAARDAALVSLLAHEGIKANELIGLRWTDYLREKDRGSLRINGSRSRAVPLSAESNELLAAYQDLFAQVKHPVIVGSTEKRMFIAFKGRDAASPLPVMTRHGLKFILYELGDKTGLRKLNTEQLRHFAVSYLIANGRTPDEIMQFLGLRRIGNIAKHIVKDKGTAKTRIIEGATRQA
ncbi:tyrosine recombinase XerD [Planctomyces bekefii]|uniref:Tyrosine recombinase XerD n=1 Tax=Planctomyces bekefii TaxID=1653850 RepID=A0A5C6MEG2_9PLAN|nr:tyrosine recombinase XerD [Planctomyces bekefii]